MPGPDSQTRPARTARRIVVTALAAVVLVGTSAGIDVARAAPSPLSFTGTTVRVDGSFGITAKGPAGNHTDLVAAGPGGTTVLANDGSGTFSIAQSFPTASSASLPAVDLGDLNGDGCDDVGGLGFILWGGAGGAYTQQDIPAPAGSGGVAAGDVNGDGVGDLAFTQWGASTVTLWLGGPGAVGSWAPASTEVEPVGANPFGLAIADLDRDGRGEVVVANGSANSITIYHGAGGFPYLQTRLDLATLPGGYPTPDDVSIADVDANGSPDVDANGSPDVVAVCRFPAQASTFLNDGHGGLAPAVGSPIGPSWTWDSRASAVADFNGDGHADLVTPVPWEYFAGPQNVVAVLLGDSTGFFGSEQDFTVGFGPHAQPGDVVTGDFNADGLQDFAVSNSAENSVTVMLQDPPPTTTTTESPPPTTTTTTTTEPPTTTTTTTTRPMPTSADQCKRDGWRSFGVFRNQGDCVSHVSTGGRNGPGA